MATIANAFCKKISFGLCAGFTSSCARSFHAIVRPAALSFVQTVQIPRTAPAAISPPNAVFGQQQLLMPFLPLLTQICGFKVKGRMKRRCKDCYFVRRHDRLYIICPTHPRHKQMSMKARPESSWKLTHATQSKVRPY